MVRSLTQRAKKQSFLWYNIKWLVPQVLNVMQSLIQYLCYVTLSWLQRDILVILEAAYGPVHPILEHIFLNLMPAQTILIGIMLLARRAASPGENLVPYVHAQRIG